MSNQNTKLLKSLKGSEFPDNWSLLDMVDLYDRQVLEYLLSKLTKNE